MDVNLTRLSAEIDAMIKAAEQLSLEQEFLNLATPEDRERSELVGRKVLLMWDQIRAMGIALSLAIDADLSKSIRPPDQSDTVERSTTLLR